jgi:hypothetical protein
MHDTDAFEHLPGAILAYQVMQRIAIKMGDGSLIPFTLN